MEYRLEYGVSSSRIDRFGGEPTWVEVALREYELGDRGPRHECVDNCTCLPCQKLRWLSNPKCNCKLGSRVWSCLGLDEAMRHKWLRCRCTPEILPVPEESVCPCILLLPTQKFDIDAFCRGRQPGDTGIGVASSPVEYADGGGSEVLEDGSSVWRIT